MTKISFLTLGLALFSLFGAKDASARFYRRFGYGYWHGPRYYSPAWRTGYWYHGAYGDRRGWWWVVGPSWYYYSAPAYPYPAVDSNPVYVVQVTTPPPPSPAPAVTTYATPSSPPTTSPTPTPVATPPVAEQAETKPSESKVMAPSVGKPAFTYYCEKTKGYYPATKNCLDGWVASPVPAPGAN